MQRIALALALCTAVCPRIHAAEKIDLQFRPTPEQKQMFRLVAAMDVAQQMGPQEMVTTNTRTMTLTVEPLETADDGTLAIDVRFVAIREEGGMKGAEQTIQYDSAEPSETDNPMARYYSPFIGECCPVKVSPRGEVRELGTDELFLAVAANMMEQEDAAMRQQLGDRASDAIMRTDQKYGSREGRRQALKKQIEAFPLMNADHIRGLVSELIVRLPEGPVQPGDSWQGSVAMFANTPLGMQDTCTLTAATDEKCTIEANAERTMDDEPIVSTTAAGKTTTKLAGTATATIDIDPSTGLLLAQKTQMNFTGETQMPAGAQQAQPMTVKMSMEGTTTVERIE
jgi:hypothetical protein